MLPLVTAEGFRRDGRRSDEVRRMSVTLVPAPIDGAYSAVEAAMGLTRVRCCIITPPPFTQQQRAASGLRVTVVFAPFATDRRRGARDSALVHTAALIRQTFERAVDADVCAAAAVTILSDDGAILAAAINAVQVALIYAGIPLIDAISAAAAAVADDAFIADPNSEEMKRIRRTNGADVTVAMTQRSKQIALLQMNGTCRAPTLVRLRDCALAATSTSAAALRAM